jgi:hypothetical protein
MPDPSDIALAAYAHRMCVDGSARTLRLEADLPLSAVAEMIGVSKVSLHRYEVGKRPLSDKRAAIYGRVLAQLPTISAPRRWARKP